MKESYFEAILEPEKGPDEILYQDDMFLVERKNNFIEVTGKGPIKDCFIYEENKLP